MPEQNPIYSFLKDNNLTQLGEEEWSNKYSDPKNASQVHKFFVDNGLTQLDETGFYDKYLKKKEVSEPSFQTWPQKSLEQGVGLGVKPISSTTSPSALKQPKPTTPSVSIGDGETGALKPVGELWKDRPIGKDYDWDAHKPQTLKQYLIANPDEKQKYDSWDVTTTTGQANRAQIVTNMFTQNVEPMVKRLQELDDEGIPTYLKAANLVAADIDKKKDELKKGQTEINFYLNTYLKDKGYDDIINQSKALKEEINKFDAKGFEQTTESLKKEISTLEANMSALATPEGVPQEHWNEYVALRADYEGKLKQYNSLVESPWVAAFNEKLNQYNQLVAQQNELATGLQSNPKYKKALEKYQKDLEIYGSLVDGYKQYQDLSPEFKEYVNLSKRVNDEKQRYDAYMRAYPEPMERKKVQELVDLMAKTGVPYFSDLAKMGGVLQSLPAAANTLLSGLTSAMGAVDKTMQGKEFYSVYDKMSDYFEGLNKFNSYIVPTANAINKDGSLNWSEIPYEAMSQFGNMALFATIGGYGKGALVAAGYFLSRKQREQEADEAGLKGPQKEAYVSTLSLLEGLSELIMPDNQYFTQNLRKMLLKDAVLAQTKGIGWFMKRAMKVVLENMGKESAEEYIVRLGELMQKMAINYNNGNVFDMKQYKSFNEWVRTGLVAAPLAGISTTIAQATVPQKELNIARYEAAKNLTQARVILDDLVEGGKMTAEKADMEYKKIANYAAVQSIIPKDISNAKAVELVPLLVENEALRLKLSEVDDVFKKQIKEKIDANVEKAQAILESKEEKPELVQQSEEKTGQVEPQVEAPTEINKSIKDEIVKYATETELKAISGVDDILKKMNNAEYVNENEITPVTDNLYNMLDDIDKREDISPEAKKEISNSIESLITQLEGYEFTTTTKTKTVTEKVPTETVRKTIGPEKEIRHPFQVAEGAETELTTKEGNVRSGTIKNLGGEVVLQVKGGEQIVLGSTEAANRGLKVAEDGILLDPETDALESVTLEMPNGNKITIRGDQALDLAIDMRMRDVGYVEQDVFDTVYQEVEKEVQEEVLKSTGEPIAKEAKPAKEEPTPQAEVATEGPKLKPEEESNLKSIEEKVGDNFRKIGNIYSKYGEGKPLSEITEKDYEKALENYNDKKTQSRTEVFNTLITIDDINAKKEKVPTDEKKLKKANAKLDELFENDPKRSKEARELFDLIPEIRAALMEKEEIESIDCRWGISKK